MKMILAATLLFVSVSSFAQVKKEVSCELKALAEILDAATVDGKVKALVASGDHESLLKIQDSAYETAILVCK